MTPSELATRYFECIRARDIDSLIGLYAKDATFVLPNGTVFTGISQIRETQLAVFAASPPIPTPLVTVVSDRTVAVEIEAKLPDGSVRHTANFFHLDDNGHILRLSVYMQGSEVRLGP